MKTNYPYVIVFLMLMLYTLIVSSITLNKVKEEITVSLDSNISITPIIENEDLGSKYWYIRSIKVYYKDPIKKPIYLNNGDSLNSYCSDSSIITFKSISDSISISSIKRMSCKILAIINLTKRDSEWLKSHIVYEFIVLNTVTNNRYVIYMDDKQYFKKLLTKYNANY